MKKVAIAITLMVSSCAVVYAGEFDETIPMRDKGASTYYVKGEITGLGDIDFMVDTGSGYMTINEHSLASLKANG